MTPVQLNTYARACAKRRSEEQRLTQANIYSLAALIRPMVWSKSPPSFSAAFPNAQSEKKRQDPMSDDEMYAIARALNALFGGEEVS